MENLIVWNCKIVGSWNGNGQKKRSRTLGRQWIRNWNRCTSSSSLLFS